MKVLPGDGKDEIKKVIFIGGTAFSGSTFFQLILANDPQGFAVGEAQSFFHPTRKYHFDPLCSCGEVSCPFWEQVRTVPVDQFYLKLFELYPKVDFIVDSSKYPYWIKERSERLAAQNIGVYNLLIWKTPEELAKSYQKRGNMQAWESAWVRYHRRYFTLMDNWVAVKYSQLAKNREILSAVCDYLEIADYAGKESYWNNTYHAFAGNPTARVHLYDQGSLDFNDNVERSGSAIGVNEMENFKKIYYQSDLDDALRLSVAERVRNNPHIPQILEVLEAKDLLQAADQTDDLTAQISQLKLPTYFFKASRIKQLIEQKAARIRYGG
jgi:hypothetical protein